MTRWERSAGHYASPASAPGPDLASTCRLLLAAVALALVAVLSPLLQHRARVLELADLEPGFEGPWQLRGTVIREPQPTDGGSAFDLRVKQVRVGRAWHPSSGRIGINVAGDADPELLPGDLIETFLRLRLVRPPWNPGQSRPAANPSHDALARLKSYRQLRVLQRAHGPGTWSARVRNAIRRAIECRFRGYDALASALLLGERGRVPDRITLAMGHTGLAHLLAISGLHLGLLVAGTLALSRALGLRPRTGLGAGVAVALLVPLIVTPRAAVARAALMTLVALGSRWRGRRVATLDVVATTVGLILVTQPTSARDPGLWLSITAVTAIVLAGAGAAAAGTPPPLMLLLVPIAAQIGVAPVMAHLTAEVATGGVLLNLLAVPLLSLVMPLLYAAVVLHGIGAGSLSDLVGTAAGFGLEALVRLADWAAIQPWVSVTVPSPSIPTAVMWWGGLVLAWVTPWHLARCYRPLCRGIGLGLALAGALTACRAPASSAVPSFVVLDVGQGDSLLLAEATGAVLIDAGGYPGVDYDVGGHVVAPTLRRLGIHRLKALGGTHAHADHFGGLPAIARWFPATELWLPPTPPSSRLQLALLQAGSRATALTPWGMRRLGGCEWGPLRPPVGLLVAAEGKVSNEASLVLRLQCGPRRLLLTGDAGLEAERHWSLTGLRGGILKVGHHGSASATGEELLRRLRPRHALISVGARNAFGLPRDVTLRRLRALPAAVYRTDRDGAITLRLGARVRVSGTRWRAGS